MSKQAMLADDDALSAEDQAALREAAESERVAMERFESRPGPVTRKIFGPRAQGPQ